MSDKLEITQASIKGTAEYKGLIMYFEVDEETGFITIQPKKSDSFRFIKSDPRLVKLIGEMLILLSEGTAKNGEKK